MNVKKDFVSSAIKEMKVDDQLSNEQKNLMLQSILTAEGQTEISPITRVKSFITTYPWRFAFAASTIQTIILTIVFQTNYTNFILSIL